MRFTIVDSQTDKVLGYFYDTPQCGEDFCVVCGDCLYCFSGDSTCTNGAHDWNKYVAGLEEAKRLCEERGVIFISVSANRWLEYALDDVLCRVESRETILENLKRLGSGTVEPTKNVYRLAEAHDVGRLRTAFDALDEYGYRPDSLTSASSLLDDALDALMDGDLERYYKVMRDVKEEIDPENA